MKFFIETDTVRGMAARFTKTSESIDSHMAVLVYSVETADWQSQAREEFIIQLKTLQQSLMQAGRAMDLMGQAARTKADRWEWLASRFNAARQASGNMWGSVLSALDSIRSTNWLDLIRLKIPSVPKYVGGFLVGTGIAYLSPWLIIGGLHILKPGWDWKPPSWWPVGKDGKPSVKLTPSGTDSQPTSGSNTNPETLGENPPKSPPPPQPSPPSYVGKYDGGKPAQGMDSSYGKPGQWPLDAPVKSVPGERSAELYEDVINQFGVGNNSRYAPSDGYTYCNTFAGDVARAMGVPFPKKSDFGMNPKDPATIGFPQLYNFFTDPNAPVRAQDMGWREVSTNSLGQLESHVNQGKFAIVVNNGHIAVVQPGQSITDFKDIMISQAGATNSNNLTLGAGFGKTEAPKIFIID